ncbi:hypothetical protein Aple_064700 [Acrocarpospora pleiomorpha]|uniref:DUF2797 domain-containing protein n=1 Tax=Acrocarpospora pleiomorpha TaxID=90975 RepID=A0A5M3XVJ8_9ACTN|nr:DUF2797 domain-containing protein [Acrocarpospora pleiomorpha]GES23571.1 hypothetical protein Aple_064700 [Acrocarpospora pleiomorpha]
MGLEFGRQYLWHGVTWATGRPTLLLADAATGVLGHVEVMGLDLGLKVCGSARFCTGRYGFAGTCQVEPLPCPWQAEAGSGGQCAGCLGQDEFRFAHQFHKGGHAPPALAAYMSQPHWLYVATFAHAVSKVGTAAAPRRRSRLDEQGPTWATYLAHVPDGRAVRMLEDALSRELGLTQTVRGTAKLGALADPDPARIHAAHERVVDRAIAALADLGVSIVRDEWEPPGVSLALRSPQQQGERAVYPHDLRHGEHGFLVESCSGSHVLARLSSDATHPDGVRYVLDLNTLKGRRITIGDYTSPETILQGSLF